LPTTNYELVIEPSKGWFDIRWRELLHYRDLTLLLVRRDFVSKYKQTVLGPAWFVIQPLLTTLVFTIIFGNVARLGTDGMPHVPFYLAGLLLWSYFAQSLPAIGSCLIVNSNLFTKVYFPRLVVPLSILLSNLIALALQFVTFLAFWAYYRYATEAGAVMQANWTVLLFPLLIIQTAMLAGGVGLWLAVITSQYRDLQHLMSFIVQIWMYASFIIVPLSDVPERFRLWAALNPMVAVVEGTRYAFLGKAALTPLHIGVSAAITLVVFATGVAAFGRIERKFVDYI
jgi:lipopolysaccharide transport system permease protein